MSCSMKFVPVKMTASRLSDCETCVTSTGATVRVRTDEAFNISMTLLDGRLKDSGIWGMRVDYWDELTNSYPPESSLFFYDIKENLTVRPLPWQVSVKKKQLLRIPVFFEPKLIF